MKFDIKKNSYQSLKEVLESDSRKNLLDKNIKILDELYYKFKYYNNDDNMCNVYIFNEIIDKDIYNINKIDIIIEVNKDLFEDFVDSRVIEDINNAINLNFKINDRIYFYDHFWRYKNLDIDKMININHYIEEYEL